MTHPRTTRAVVLARTGGPEVLEMREVPLPDPGPGEVLVRHHAIGLNFIDIYQRKGTYALPLPSGLGQEAAGVVEALGEGVGHLAVGDRVAYAGGPPGAYAEARTMPAAPVCRLPDAVSYQDAAALMLKGLTVHYLFRRTVPIGPESTVLFHAAAGGVGLIACQWARSEGIRLIATAGTEAKRALALEAGATVAAGYGEAAAEVARLTDGRGADVVMDGVGRDTFDASLDALRPLGMLICFGASSGPVPPFDILRLSKGSLQLTRPTLFAHIADPEVGRGMAADLFAKVAAGAVAARVDRAVPLAQAAEAHRALEARETTGSVVLIP